MRPYLQEKLNEVDDPDRFVKLVYEWVKTGHMNLSEFREAMEQYGERWPY